MEYIHKLPFIIGTFMAIVIGIVNYKIGVDRQDVYTRMAVGLLVFFIIGLVIRNLFGGILEELEKRKKEQEELEEEKRQMEQQKLDSSVNAEGNDAEKVQSQIDYRVEDGEEFTPLKVSEIITSSGEK